MKNLILILVVVFTIQSCKDDDTPPEISTPNAGLVTTQGSYWVYLWYNIDTAENETIGFNRDSIYIAGDTAIYGNTYTIYRGMDDGRQRTRFLRDSSGFIVSSDGNIEWNMNNTGEISSSTEDRFLLTTKITNLSQNIEVLGSNLAAVELTTTMCRIDGQPMTPCEQCQTEKSYYVPRIGEVFEQTAYVGSCSKIEKRLVKYEIK